jgi:hypothetical protein
MNTPTEPPASPEAQNEARTASEAEAEILRLYLACEEAEARYISTRDQLTEVGRRLMKTSMDICLLTCAARKAGMVELEKISEGAFTRLYDIELKDASIQNHRAAIREYTFANDALKERIAGDAGANAILERIRQMADGKL